MRAFAWLDSISSTRSKWGASGREILFADKFI